MAKYRQNLPQLGGDLFLMDGGVETTLIFHDGFDLPLFASFVLLDEAEGRAALARYFQSYLGIARDKGVGMVLDTPTWRASDGWGAELGYSPADMARLNRAAVDQLVALRVGTDSDATPIVISGSIGPKGDGYNPDEFLGADQAEAYHRAQIETFAATDADLVSAITMTHAGEAIGVARAAATAQMPCVIGFTVETDGHLPTGQSIADAIAEVDEAAGDGRPTYYMVNCAHSSHFEAEFEEGAPWMERLRGLRANASRMSHAELDEAEELDDGDPEEFGRDHRALRARFPSLNVLGGCCGTDSRHIAAIY